MVSVNTLTSHRNMKQGNALFPVPSHIAKPHFFSIYRYSVLFVQLLFAGPLGQGLPIGHEFENDGNNLIMKTYNVHSTLQILFLRW